MKILFVADVSIEHVLGGAERVLREQAVRLADKGHIVFVLTRRTGDHTAKEAMIHGVHEVRYDVDDVTGLHYLVSSIRNCQALYKKITKDFSFDLINFHQPFSAYATTLLKETAAVPKIYTCHSLSFEEYASRHGAGRLFKGPLFYMNVFLRRRIEQFALRAAQEILVLSRFTKDKLTTTHTIDAEKITIIPGAADLKRFHPPADRSAVRAYLEIPEEKFVLFTVRNLVPRMGLENFIKTCAFLRPRIPELAVFIGGKGPLQARLAGMIKKYGLTNTVTLIGFVSDEDIVCYGQAADFFILPTIALEGFGLVTVEALACGTPVLGTPVGGTKEILEPFDKNFLFDDTAPEAMARLILEKYAFWKKDKKSYETLRGRCRAYAQDKYSWDTNLQLTENVFNQCAASAEK